eukprot:TRINITY_DN126035_c0_g1_i1.p1 TRINITY_DN126035_c0_g1~~TRINITY_DN126035_c0_g1_i1.p1  ORF type:complete len:301 (+),score=66.50 TRINITY_DN126035_c0_g1_i1:72-974(+)
MLPRSKKVRRVGRLKLVAAAAVVGTASLLGSRLSRLAFQQPGSSTAPKRRDALLAASGAAVGAWISGPAASRAVDLLDAATITNGGEMVDDFSMLEYIQVLERRKTSIRKFRQLLAVQIRRAQLREAFGAPTDNVDWEPKMSMPLNGKTSMKGFEFSDAVGTFVREQGLQEVNRLKDSIGTIALSLRGGVEFAKILNAKIDETTEKLIEAARQVDILRYEAPPVAGESKGHVYYGGKVEYYMQQIEDLVVVAMRLVAQTSCGNRSDMDEQKATCLSASGAYDEDDLADIGDVSNYAVPIR